MTQSIDDFFTPADKPFWRRKRWWLAGVVAVFLVSLGLANLLGRNAVARRLATIRARGEPTSYEELEAHYVAPRPEEDATTLWLKGGQAILAAAVEYQNSPLPYFGNVDDLPRPGEWPKVLEISHSFLQANRQALQDLHAAAELGGRARYPLGTSIEPMGLMNSAQSIRAAGRALALEARVRAQDGDLHGAAESIYAGILLSDSWASHPTILGQLVRSALYSISIEALRDIGPQNLTPQDLAQIQAILARVDFRRSFQQMAIGERVDWLELFDGVVAGSPAHLRCVSMFSKQSDQLALLDLRENFIEASRLSWPLAADAIDRWNLSMASVKPWNVVSNSGLSSGALAFRVLLRDETRNRLATVDLAIARYLQTNGYPPAELSALVPEFLDRVPLDPISEAPFQYRSIDDSYLLFSPRNQRVSINVSSMDAETGADPALVFRWPPRVAEPIGPADGASDATPAER